MNKVILIARLTKDADITQMKDEKKTKVARFTVAVNKRFKREGKPDADFIQCVAFGGQAKFIENYVNKGTKISIVGRWETDNYTNKEGIRIYTNTCVVEEVEFAESKAASQQNAPQSAPTSAPQSVPTSAPQDDFMNIPDGLDGDQLPFS